MSETQQKRKTDEVRLHYPIDRALHRRLKAQAANNDRTLKAELIDIIDKATR